MGIVDRNSVPMPEWVPGDVNWDNTGTSDQKLVWRPAEKAWNRELQDMCMS